VTPLRVALVADYREEGWPSMDLVADMLLERLRTEHEAAVAATLVRPPMRRRLSLLAPGRTLIVDRIMNRILDYPRLVGKLAGSFDLFHIVDHSYAHLVHALPAARTIVTCHDLDAFRSVLEPAREPRSAAFRAMTRRILSGLRQAAHVACDTEATRDGLVSTGGVAIERTTVIHNGPHPSCTPEAESTADAEAARIVGGGGRIDLLHVGSTIDRKRIDLLLRVFAAVHRDRPEVRLVRVGGAFGADHRRLAREFGVELDIVVLPFLDRATLAAIYRRSVVVLLPSEREGFGLPVLESMACGTPVVASDICALREVGGDGAVYCPLDDVEAWKQAIESLLDERRRDPAAWAARRGRAVARAASFSWTQYAASVTSLYERVAGRAAC